MFTSLTKQAMPVIRYRTRDLTRLLPGTAYPAFRRMQKVTGRTDDMMIVRGVNVFPTQVEEQILAVDGLAPHYLCVLTRPGNLDELTVRVESLVELSGGPDDTASASLGSALAERIKHRIGVTAGSRWSPRTASSGRPARRGGSRTCAAGDLARADEASGELAPDPHPGHPAVRVDVEPDLGDRPRLLRRTNRCRVSGCSRAARHQVEPLVVGRVGGSPGRGPRQPTQPGALPRKYDVSSSTCRTTPAPASANPTQSLPVVTTPRVLPALAHDAGPDRAGSGCAGDAVEGVRARRRAGRRSPARPGRWCR